LSSIILITHIKNIKHIVAQPIDPNQSNFCSNRLCVRPNLRIKSQRFSSRLCRSRPFLGKMFRSSIGA